MYFESEGPECGLSVTFVHGFGGGLEVIQDGSDIASACHG